MKLKKKENEVFSCDCHPADEDAFPPRCSQHLSFPSQWTCSTNSLLIVFLDDSSSVPRICSRHVQCEMSFCDWIFVICNFSRPSQRKFVICDPALMWGIWFVICNWNLFRGQARAPIVHDDQGTYHQNCSEFSQDPQEFREKGAVSPFMTMSSGVRNWK